MHQRVAKTQFKQSAQADSGFTIRILHRGPFNVLFIKLELRESFNTGFDNVGFEVTSFAKGGNSIIVCFPPLRQMSMQLRVAHVHRYVC